MVALWLSAMVTEGLQEPFECSPGNVLYLDWEMEAEEAQGRLGRIAEGMGFSTPPRVFYRRCVGRLVDDVEWLAETVQSKGIDLVVVDSAVPACGGNPNEPESVQGLSGQCGACVRRKPERTGVGAGAVLRAEAA